MGLMDMAKQFKDMHGEMKKAKAALAAQIVTGSGGRGAVTVEMDGTMELKRVKIDPSVLEKPDAAQLEKMVSEAFSDALHRAQKAAAGQMSRFTGGLGGMNPFA